MWFHLHQIRMQTIENAPMVDTVDTYILKETFLKKGELVPLSWKELYKKIDTSLEYVGKILSFNQHKDLKRETTGFCSRVTKSACTCKSHWLRRNLVCIKTKVWKSIFLWILHTLNFRLAVCCSRSFDKLLGIKTTITCNEGQSDVTCFLFQHQRFLC